MRGGILRKTRGQWEAKRRRIQYLMSRSECVAEMLRLGADARRVDNCGCTALHKVCFVC